MSREDRTRSLTLLDRNKESRSRETDIGAELFGFHEAAGDEIKGLDEVGSNSVRSERKAVVPEDRKDDETLVSAKQKEELYRQTEAQQKLAIQSPAGTMAIEENRGTQSKEVNTDEGTTFVPNKKVPTENFKNDRKRENQPEEDRRITPLPESYSEAPGPVAASYTPPAMERPMMEPDRLMRRSQPEYRYQYPKLEQPKPEFKSFRHMMINVYSPKGGVGKSSISKELAVAFSMASIDHTPLKVLIVDADWEFGDISTLFNVAPRPCVTDWVRDMMMDKRQTGHIHLYSRQEIAARYLIPYTDNLHILAGPGDPAEAELVTEEMVTAIIESLKRSDYDIIIFDSANSNRARSLIPLMKADAVVLVETLDTSTVAETTTILNTLRTQQFDFGKLYMVLNQVPDDDTRMDISVSEISRLLQLDIAAVIPRYEMLRMINNAGEAAVLKKGTAYSRAIFQLANRIVPVFKQEKRKGALSGLFSMFSKKR